MMNINFVKCFLFFNEALQKEKSTSVGKLDVQEITSVSLFEPDNVCT